MKIKNDILIVDDEADIRTALAGVLNDEAYTTYEAHDAESVFLSIESHRPDLVILDIWLEGSKRDGLQILADLHQFYPDIPVLMISGHGTIETAIKAIKLGAYDFIEKPFKADRLLLLVSRALEAAQLKRENQELRLRAGAVDIELVGQSPQICQLRNLIEKTAPSGSRVLISGAQGAGKEIIARQIHKNSKRADQAFVVLNCATLTPDQFEVQLFGSELPEKKIGLLEQANHGTLLLDEIADMPLETQGKIVRVLQEQNFTRLGGNRSIQVDVRVIATSNRDLQQMMEQGKLRQDLYYRLNVVPMRMPSLMERREDIPELFNHFMQLACQNANLPPRRLADDALAALQAYSWPGNVRQLRNVIEWLLIMGHQSDNLIRIDQLPPDVAGITSEVLRWEKGAEIMSLPLREARELFEREYLLSQLNRFGGNISRTATFVGMERSALHRKLKMLGLNGLDKLETDISIIEDAA